VLGAATIDRVRHGAYRVILDGESYRAPQPLPEASNRKSEKTQKSALAKTPENA
jgi:hypothetical protein